MAKYVIEDTTLTNIANAIREKTGKTDAITPSNFDTEIAGIQSGGGDTTQEDGLIEGTLTEYSNDRVTSVGDYAFYNTKLTSITLPNATKVGIYAFTNSSKISTVNILKLESISSNCFESCTSLKDVNFPNVTSAMYAAFSKCSNLTTIDIPKLTSIDGECFKSCNKLTTLDFPNLTSIGSYAFQFCKNLVEINIPNVTSIATTAFSNTGLTTLDLPKISNIVSNCFSYATKLEKLILRSETICSLENTNAFYSTPIASETGYIYVPDNLVDGYKNATNWSTYADQIKPISELEASA